jgi:hypothetical protein
MLTAEEKSAMWEEIDLQERALERKFPYSSTGAHISFTPEQLEDIEARRLKLKRALERDGTN